MKLFDTHTHTNYSHDSQISPEDRVLCAISEGLDGVYITDHADFFNFDAQNAQGSIDTAEFLKEKYKSKIYVGSGMELGAEMFSDDITNHMKSFAENTDITLLSVHNLHMGNDKNAPLRGAISSSEDYAASVDFLKYYMDNVLYVSENIDFDVLCHLTYPLRYFNGNKNYGIDMWQYEEKIVKIFENLIKRNICLELNLSGMLTAWNTYVPDADFFKLYRSLGGKLVSLGTDSHANKKVRHVMENAISFLRSLGFEYYVCYKNHTPFEISIA